MSRSYSYLEWLCIRAGLRANSSLGRKIHSVVFTPVINNDDNREIEARELRYIYEDISHQEYPYGSILGPVTMLELFVSFAQRGEDAFGNCGFASTREDWFSIFLENLSLRNDMTTREVRIVLRRFNDRRYEPDGTGGLFPLKNPYKDQRYEELWYQMNDYVNENEIVEEVTTLGYEED